MTTPTEQVNSDLAAIFPPSSVTVPDFLTMRQTPEQAKLTQQILSPGNVTVPDIFPAPPVSAPSQASNSTALQTRLGQYTENAEHSIALLKRWCKRFQPDLQDDFGEDGAALCTLMNSGDFGPVTSALNAISLRGLVLAAEISPQHASLVYFVADAIVAEIEATGEDDDPELDQLVQLLDRLQIRIKALTSLHPAYFEVDNLSY